MLDLKRDPQTLVISQKSIQEADILSRAQNDNYLDDLTNIRRPYNVSESKYDFVGTKNSTGE